MKNIITLVLLLGCTIHVQAQLIARFTVKAGAYPAANLPLSCAFDTLIMDWEEVELVEVKGKERLITPFQIEPGKIWFILMSNTKPGETRVFELQERKYPVKVIIDLVWALDTAGVLTISEMGKARLQYHTVGIDTIYHRSGFIHPLWAPNSQVLTNIQPRDHLHHYGIWNPFTHALFREKEVDFWNMQKKEGRVDFVSFVSKSMGKVYGGFKALQQHMAGDVKALDELLDVKVYYSGADSARYIWDYTSTLNCAGLDEIIMQQYRYGGGFGLRATADWKADNTTLLTDAGKTRNNSDSTRARWVKITGHTAKGRSGMLILCAPDNFDAPQPLRVWDEKAEHGELMLNYSPTKMKEWRMHYGREYSQRYRVVVFDNDLSVAESEAAWQAFAHPPKVTCVLLHGKQ
ncbi:DUF6807 domain-containing protein [Chitinophaga sancti]|uniref:Methane oxygenase PmoA n=1 Tax=Chitinophaga sancti TaxID=1004 RepID=A0A1K1QSY7_9BACT|nr:PmoA family protein [Chitinophaga sancti]WQD61896.1 PmoA family protein [Chitinophaga sancti]WQG92535.1 PmoA family protein [Chitinophaga sancti]SFW62992.1 Methane oxygenase PmoA [Chitinophaga sancti]